MPRFKLEVQAGGQAGNVELGNADLQFSVKKQSGTILNMLNSRNITPIFQLVGVKRKWFSDSVGPLKSIRLMSMAPAKRDNTEGKSLYINVLKYEE